MSALPEPTLHPRPGRWLGPLALFGLIAGIVLIGTLMGHVHPLAAGLVLACALAGLLVRPRHAAKDTAGRAKSAEAAPAAQRVKVDPPLIALVAALPEPALLLSPAGEILTANARVGLVVGAAKVGDPISFLVRVPEVLEAVRAGAEDGVSRRVEFAERIPLDRWLEAHAAPVYLNAAPGALATGRPEGRPDAVLLTFRDLTAQRRVEQMRADFVANASHELRTPLASLSGFIETLLGPARNDAAARERFLAIMGAQARRMSRLIDDLLSLSRIELNLHVRPDTQVDLNGILAHVCDTLTPLAHDRGVEIAFSADAEPAPVRGDRDELIRLFENLVENGLKYGVSGKKVEVAVVREPGPGAGLAAISVRDYGPGIAPEHLPRLTERFYRVDVAASRDQGGTGLGLAIVKHIIARHRGRMAVESVPGEGAKFTVRLELAAGGAKSEVSPAA